MSHFSRIKTRMVERKYIAAALTDLGYEFEEGAVYVRGWAGFRQPAEIRIHTRGYDIGFRRAGDAYECVADWAGVRGIGQKAFIDRVSQRYAYHATRAQLAEQGFEMVEEERTSDGRIHLVLRRIS